MSAVIGKDGRIQNLKSLSGPQELIPAAVGALQHMSPEYPSDTPHHDVCSHRLTRADKLAEKFDIAPMEELSPRYNIAPTQVVAVNAVRVSKLNVVRITLARCPSLRLKNWDGMRAAEFSGALLRPHGSTFNFILQRGAPVRDVLDAAREAGLPAWQLRFGEGNDALWARSSVVELTKRVQIKTEPVKRRVAYSIRARLRQGRFLHARPAPTGQGTSISDGGK